MVDISRSVSVLEEIVYAPSPCVSHCSFLIWLLPHVVSDLFCIYFSFLLLQRFPCRRFSFWSSGFGPAVTRGAFVLRPSWGTEKGLSFRRTSQLRTCGPWLCVCVCCKANYNSFGQGSGVTLSVPYGLARRVHSAGVPLPKTCLPSDQCSFRIDAAPFEVKWPRLSFKKRTGTVDSLWPHIKPT